MKKETFSIVFHLGLSKFDKYTMDSIDQLINVCNYIKIILKDFAIHTRIKVYFAETINSSGEINYICDYIKANINEDAPIITYHPEYYATKNKDVPTVKIDAPSIDVPAHFYAKCNKSMVLRLDKNKPVVQWGYCCGAKIPAKDFMTTFNKSVFLYKLSRDWVYCDRPIKTKTVERYKTEVSETDSVTITCGDIGNEYEREDFKC